MVQGLNGLRHHAVIRCDHKNSDVGNLRTAGTHSGKRLVTGGIDEGNSTVFSLNGGVYLVRTDVLGNAAGLALNDVGVTDGIQQAGFTVVNVTHHGHNRRAHLKLFIAFSSRFGLKVNVEGLQQFTLFVFGGNDLNNVPQLGTQQLKRVLVQGLGLSCHLTQVEEHRNQGCGVRANLLGKVHDGGAAAHTDFG